MTAPDRCVSGPEAQGAVSGAFVEELLTCRRELLDLLGTADAAIVSMLSDPSLRSAIGYLPGPPPIDVHCPLEEADRRLRTYLEPLLDLSFADGGVTRVPAVGRRLSRLCRRLRRSADAYASCADLLALTGDRLALRHPGHTSSLYGQAAAALVVLAGWEADDRERRTADRTVLERNVITALARDGALHLVLFVCPPVDFRRLQDNRPEAYLLDHFHGSVLSRLTRRLRTLCRQLQEVDVPALVHAVLADTDEADYLFVGLDAPPVLDPDLLHAQWDHLAVELVTYLSESVPAKEGMAPRVADRNSVRVSRLSSFGRSPEGDALWRSVTRDPQRYFTASDFGQELAIMEGLWGRDDYYEGLARPDPAGMCRILTRKFAAYAVQGLLLHQIDPDLILIQTERPALLRERMFATGWEQAGRRPVATIQYFPAN